MNAEWMCMKTVFPTASPKSECISSIFTCNDSGLVIRIITKSHTHRSSDQMLPGKEFRVLTADHEQLTSTAACECSSVERRLVERQLQLPYTVFSNTETKQVMEWPLDFKSSSWRPYYSYWVKAASCECRPLGGQVTLSESSLLSMKAIYSHAIDTEWKQPVVSIVLIAIYSHTTDIEQKHFFSLAAACDSRTTEKSTNHKSCTETQTRNFTQKPGT